VLEVEDLLVALPMRGQLVPVLSGVSFALDRGQSVGLVGESGSGKSVTALAIMGLLPPGARVAGRIALDGRDLLAASEPDLCAIRGRRIGMVFQEPMTALNPLMSIGAQVAEPLRVHFALSRAEADARARRLLERVGLGGKVSPDRYPHQLSGGQRQRVVIAAALACGPDLLIADEPTTALDVTVQAQVLALLAELAEETGMGLLLITHDLGVVSQTVARVMVMYAGRVVEQGPTGDVFATMAHPYTRALFAARPAESGGRPVAIPGQVPDPLHRPPGCAFAPRCGRVQPVCAHQVPPLEGAGLHLRSCFNPEVAP
jgi:peptide/nickel transport system ATP-binding protein